jgi:chemotaxis protein methyltransferase CheR
LATTEPHTENSNPSVKPAGLQRQTARPSISPELFKKFQRLIHQQTGIWLSDSKVLLLCGRLSRRLRALEIPTLERYYQLVIDADQQEERDSMIDAITTNETRFFREPRQFEFLEQRAIPVWKAEAQQGLRSRTLRLWSAGCSSGEEPYSLAMLMARNLPGSEGWNVTILATDVSTQMLDQARVGIYRMEKSLEIPEPLLKDHMLKGVADQTGKMKVMPEMQQMVEFQRLNLMQDAYPGSCSFDAIFCRNVLIYFDLASKSKVVEGLIRCLQPRGLLFLGQAENLSGVNSQLRTLAPAVYVRSGEQIAF